MTDEHRRAGETFRILCVGDIHLGRRPGRIAELLGDDSDLKISELGSDAAWRLTVSWALDNDIDAVLLAGDVVESLDDRFKAYGYLEKGVRDLNAAGIAVVGVAGNHDGVALPRLASRIEGFHLLGKGGKWEMLDLIKVAAETSAETSSEVPAEASTRAPAAGRRSRLRLLGWSFQGRRVRSNPLSSLPELSELPAPGILDISTSQESALSSGFEREAEASAGYAASAHDVSANGDAASAHNGSAAAGAASPDYVSAGADSASAGDTSAAGDLVATIGILHCDLDGGKSEYAPVPRGELEAAPCDAWLLGHIHKPDDLSGTRPLGYLGSLVGLDPGESGRHGPWLARVSRGGAVTMEQIALAPLRWEQVDVDISAIGISAIGSEGEGLPGDRADIEDEIAAAISTALNSLHEDLAAECCRPRAVACRIRLCGQGPAHSALRACLEADRDSAAADALYQQLRRDETTYFVEKVIDDAGPSLDLESIAAGSDPPALLARRLLLLRKGGIEAERLLEKSAIYTDKAVSFLRELGGPEEGIEVSPGRERLLRAGFALLEELLSQKDQRTEHGS